MQSINIRFENGKVNIIVDGALFKDVHSLSLDYIKGAPMLFACVSDVGEQQDKVTDFFDIATFGKTADFVGQYFSKGQLVAIRGRLQQRDWTDKQGNKRRTTEVIAERCYFAEKRQTPAAVQPADFSQLPITTPVPFSEPDMPQMEISDENELPF